MRALLMSGFILLGVAALLSLADWGGLSERMPTQVLPRRAARYPLLAGAALIVLGLVVHLFDG